MGDWREDFKREVTEFYPTEGERLDFKEGWENIIDNEQRLLDFLIKPVIALGNSARRIGALCYLVYGVHDKNRSLISMVGTSPHSSWRPRSADEDYDTTVTDVFAPRLLRKIEEYITPSPRDVVSLHAWSHDNSRITYFKINPTTGDYFRLNRNISGFEQGTPFIRYGASSIKVSPADVGKLVKYSEAAYLDKDSWRDLVTATSHLKRDDKVGWHFVHSISPLYTVEQSLKQGDRRIIVTGKAGTGKSRLLLELADRYSSRYPLQSNETDGSAWNYEMLSPLPIVLTLRGEQFGGNAADPLEELEASFARQISSLCLKLNANDVLPLSRLWAIPGSQWLLLIDGLDEISESSQQVFASWVGTRLGFANVQVVVSSRPDPPILSQFTEISITPPYADQIEDIFKTLISALPDIDLTGVANQFREYIQRDSEFAKIVTNMRTLTEFAKSLVPFLIEEGETIPTSTERASTKHESINVGTKEKTANAKDMHGIGLDINQLVVSGDAVYGQGGEIDEPENLDAPPEFPEVNYPITLRKLTNALISSEIRRRRRRQVQNAWRTLENTAWESDWSKLTVPIHDDNQRRNLEMIEAMGLITVHHNCNFGTHLLQHYLASERYLPADAELDSPARSKLDVSTPTSQRVREFRDALQVPREFPEH